MKKFFKVIPAALALVALASCSNDDFLGSDNLDSLDGKTVLKVTTGDGTTRANAYGSDAITVFGTGDVIRVYDDKLQKYDGFNYATDAEGDSYFVVEDEENRKVAAGEAAFALFGAEGEISYAGWNNGKNVALLKIGNPAAVYDEGVNANDVVTYKSALPLWGKVIKAEGKKYEFETELARLTGYAAITFSNGKYGKVTAVRARSLKLTEAGATANYKPTKGYTINSDNKVMNGATEIVTDEATYVTAEGAKAMSGWFDAVLEENGELTTTSAPVAKTDNPNIVEVTVDPTKMKDYTNIVYLPIVPGKYDLLSFEYKTVDDEDNAVWHVIGCAKNFTAKRTDALQFSVGFAAKLNQVVPEELSDILAGDANNSADLTYDITTLLVNAKDYHARYEVRLPAMKAENVTLNVATLKNIVAELGSQNIVFMNADDENPFTGTLTLNVKAIADDNGETKGCPITIDLPNAKNVVLAGNYSTAYNTTKNKITIAAAKNLAIGDGTTKTTIGTARLKITGEGGKSTIAESLTIAENATVGQNIALGTDVKNTFKVNIGGEISEDILSVYRATTKVTGKGKVQTLRSMGNVTIEGTRSDFAVGNLFLNGTGQKVDLKSGIVLKIGTQSETANRTATVNNEETGATYIGSINGNNKITITLGTSKWAGKKLTGSYADKNNIYTASMLASITGSSASSYVLMNNINLNGEACDWKPVALKKAFDGNKKTISNLKSTTGGLFNVTMSSAAEINNLTIADPIIALDAKSVTGVGVLANTVATSQLTVTNVKATNITITGKDATSKVGGLIGTNSSKVVLSGVSTTGTIAGYSMLGGLIGYAGGNVTIQKNGDNKSTSTVSISANYNSGEDYDLNYAEAGQFIGSMDKNAVIEMTDVTVGTTGFTHDTGEFKGKILYPVVSGAKVTGKEVKFGQDLIGYSGDEAISEKVTINGDANKYSSFATKQAYTEALGDATSILYLYYIDK